MRSYLDLARYVLENGEKRGDRTGTGTLSVFGTKLEYDLREGFPLLTTKKVHWPSVVHELLFFLNGYTNNSYLEENKVRIWREWSNRHNDLPKTYGHNWRRWETISEEFELVKIRDREPDQENPTYSEPLIDFHALEKHDLLGASFSNSEGLEFRVLEKVSEKGEKNSRYRVQFIDNGYCTEASRPNIEKGQVENPYHLSVYEVACLGEPREYDAFEYDLWHNMIARCYNKDHPSYAFYGGKGVTVSTEWRCFANFLRDLTNVPFYYSWKRSPSSYELDKDYYCADQYSKSTCLFLDKPYNKKMSNSCFVYKGEVFASQKDCADKYGLDARRISEVLRGQRSKSGEYTMSPCETPQGYVVRKKRVVDQLAKLITKIKDNPEDRRMLLNTWDAATVDHAALPPCHMMFQCYVNKEKELSLQIYQRSVDVFLGLPFNIASYALLIHILAKACDLSPGKLHWVGGDTHIYLNHIDQIKEQLSRNPRDFPDLQIIAKKDPWDYKFEDFMLTDYNPHPPIKGKISV